MHKLVIVGTPLGNLEDISIRALKKIFSAKYVLAEDTRNFFKLKNLVSEKFSEILKILNQNFETQVVLSYRDQNHKRMIEKIKEILNQEECILLSDSGMPLISDPGYLLVRDLIKFNIEIEVIPSPTAFVSGLVVSGLPVSSFTFLGFLPRKDSKIRKLIEQNIHNTICFYESPYRLIKVIELIAQHFPDTYLSLSNDITKKFELNIRGTPRDIITLLQKKNIKGEWVVCISKDSKSLD